LRPVTQLRFSILRVTLLLTVAPLLLWTVGCRASQPPASQTRTVTDEYDRTIKVPAVPQRIVSLAPSVTEVLFAIGLGDRVAGVTTYCNYPPEANGKERIGDTMRPSLEKIIALKADLVIAVTASQLEQFVGRLDEAGIPVYVSNPRNLDEVLTSIEKIGELTGAPERARALAGALRERAERVSQRLTGATRLPVLFVLGTSPLITVGRGTFIDDLITRAGGRSITSDVAGDYPQFSVESVIARKPEVIFLQSGDSDLTPPLKETPASRSGRVVHLDDDLLLRPGPRVIEALEQMAASIHPDMFTRGEAQR
jgi:iron complex transport system substrate-binding protein